MTAFALSWRGPAARETTEPEKAPRPVPLCTDAELIRRAQQGDRPAFGELIRRYQGAVFNVTLRMTGNRPDAEDAAQETFLRAFRAFDRFDPDQPPAPWLKRIAVNVCLNLFEARRIRPATTESDLARPGTDTPGLDHWSHPQPGPEQRLLHAEQAAQIHRAILALPPHYRAVIELRHFQELSYEEMAETLERSLPNVKSDLFRARRQLRQLLAGPLPSAHER